MSPQDSILLQSHESRLQKVEDDVGTIAEKVLPSLARLEQMVTSGFERFDEFKESVTKRMDDIDRDHMISQTNRATADVDVKALKKTERVRRDRVKSVITWVAGVAAAVLAAAVAAHFGWNAK